MKRILLLLSVVFCCVCGYAQSLTVTPNTVTAGSVVTITGSGETLANHFASINRLPTSDRNSDGTPTSASISTGTPYEFNSFNGTTNTPSNFKIVVNNTSPFSYVVDLAFSATVSGSNTPAVIYARVTINATPAIAYNDVQTRTFTKSCGAGYEAEPYTYTVPASKYSAATKAEANAKAVAEINANGQNEANAQTTCKIVYYNVALSSTFYRNNCGTTGFGSAPISYSIAANSAKSLVSQEDANNQAQLILNTTGQAYANSVGGCTIAPITGPSSICTGNTGVFSINNLPAGITVVSWTGQIGTVVLRSSGNSVTVGYNVSSGGALKGNIIANLSNGATISKAYTYFICENSPE